MKVKDEDFKSIVYISHPYSGLKENEEKVADIINNLRKDYPEYLFISPVHTFSYAYTSTNYDLGLSWCLWLLDKCDEMWVFGDWKNSKGCLKEIEYCEENHILIQFDIDKLV